MHASKIEGNRYRIRTIFIYFCQETLSQQVPKLMKFTQQTRSDRHAVCNYLCVSEEADCRTCSGSVTFCKTLFSKRK